ncbi:branched-chain amino acid ABC transporter permease [Serpentinicella sp. ANB-PHB4]|uniref:branched-chain amino acid ABC transporter permease n=1 Tax=Serpentinicella sp. ANB-PHB4 TaxID=3074076 RepID=UPI00285CB263|nr:branched-chain amino acid ABC transporter permease [Serpentinicella sp. ANB-PHB4]MDR5658608.1 branched-chain amino acid ABC transporter permease [Serpentinicella sp. ANB-PHB4]
MGKAKVKVNAADMIGSKKMSPVQIGALLALIATFVALPFFIGNTTIVLVCRIFILGVYGMSYDILRGYTGIINLGQASFFGSGVYIGVLALRREADMLHFIVALLGATVFCLLVGFLYSKIVLLTGGVVPGAMITLALAEIVRNLAERWYTVTGGQDGLSLRASSLAINFTSASIRLGGRDKLIGLYLFTFVFLIVMTLVLRQFVMSPTGRVLMAIRENDQRAKFLGYNTDHYKTIAFLVSAVASGLAGVFFSIVVRFAGTDYLSIQTTLDALLMTLVGGTGTLYGAIIGSGLVTYLQNLLLNLAREYSDFRLLRFPMIFIGSIYVAIVMFMPSGIMGGVYKLQAMRKLKKSQANK